jgi:5'(3')-deoxyribonucleotidase
MIFIYTVYMGGIRQNKLQACIHAKVDVLIDDGPHYAEEFALANKPVILYEQPYNLSVANEFVYRASNWIEVKKQIDYLESISTPESM